MKINVYVNIFTRLCSCHGYDYLCKVVRHSHDNAIEASVESSRKELHLGIESEDDGISIFIGNSYFHEPNPNLIFKRGYSTKGKNRGLGLYNVKEILSQYPSVSLKSTVQNNTFFQEIIIPN